MYNVLPVTTPHATACGPACLKMLLAYYGVEATLEELIDECGCGVTGATMARLAQVGRSHGLEELAAWRTDAEGVMTQDRPGIIWWKYQHYVVFCGLNDKGEPVICNPASGRFPISRDAFSRFYAGAELCSGAPADFVPTAAANVEAGRIFTQGSAAWRALLPIARGEALRLGVNCESVNLTDLLNERESEE